MCIRDRATDSAFEYKFKGSNALIMGSEDKGIQPGIMKVITDKVKLPMGDNMASLNVSVACGIILFEILRQEQFVQINLK